ncbi:MAG: hypothetical protein CME63_01440 [Halobacteriovoraceae bacterium]|nr:hypothetical protein [Halobacteriovoraceae bacterium]|tara:strand:+ start:20639 stop:21091 length:453 start_codon:yes stop_codon:yes gene_type:complete
MESATLLHYPLERTQQTIQFELCHDFPNRGGSMETPQVIFWQMLYELMEQKGIENERQFAHEIDIPPTTVNQWTRAQAVVKEHSHIRKLCQFFKVPYEYLMFGIGIDADELNEIVERQNKQIEELRLRLGFVEGERDLYARQLDMFGGNQ